MFAFGSFPEGYELGESEVIELPRAPLDDGIGPVEGEEEPRLGEDAAMQTPHEKPD